MFLFRMFKFLIVSFYLVLFYLASSSFGRCAYALEVNDLYQASINVDSQNSGERKRALKQAMQAVLLKVGGQLSVLENNLLKKSLTTANSFITQYHYQQINRPISPSVNKQLSLVVSFNEDKINKLFSQANLPIWGSLRPQVLLWIIDEQGLRRTIISNSTMLNSTEINFPLLVNDFSRQRGLPLLMPLMDFDDANQITLSDLWGRFEQPIRYASARYFPEAIVVMRISNSSLVALDESSGLDSIEISDTINNNGNSVKSSALKSNCGLLCSKEKASYVLDWSLLSSQALTSRQDFGAKQKSSQQYLGTNKTELFQQGLADITEIIYQQYALSTEVNNNFVIEVGNIESLTAYTQLFHFLTELSAVKSVTLTSAKGSMRRFNLQLLGSKNALLASLKLNKQLQQYIDPLVQVDESDIPLFYWEQR